MEQKLTYPVLIDGMNSFTYVKAVTPEDAAKAAIALMRPPEQFKETLGKKQFGICSYLTAQGHEITVYEPRKPKKPRKLSKQVINDRREKMAIRLEQMLSYIPEDEEDDVRFSKVDVMELIEDLSTF